MHEKHKIIFVGGDIDQVKEIFCVKNVATTE